MSMRAAVCRVAGRCTTINRFLSPGAYRRHLQAARGCIIAGRFLRRREACMLGWFKAIMPKEERFFALFVQRRSGRR